MKSRTRLLRVADRLAQRYGEMEISGPRDPLAMLVLTILSQNTNDTNRDRAYEALVARYPSYETIVAADPKDVAEAIRIGGLHRQKARRIQQILREIHRDHGSYDLEHLRAMDRDEALKTLTAYKGVGLKTAGIVLTFALDKPYFPVDTHIGRIARRLGFVEDRQDPHEVMNRLVPPERMAALHLHLIEHGRETCRARKPACEVCVIRAYCPVPEHGLPPG